MINYKKELKNNLKIIHNYYNYLSKYKLNNKNINRFNELFLSMYDLFNFRINKISNEQFFLYIKSILINNEYNLSFDKLTKEIINYQSNNTLQYHDIWEIKNIIYILCIGEIKNMLDYEKDNVVTYNSRKAKTLQYIKNTLENILNKTNICLSDNMLLTSIKMLDYKEYKYISDEDKILIINKIIEKSKKEKIPEIEILNKMIGGGKYFGDTIIPKYNYFPCVIIFYILIILFSIGLNIYFKSIYLLIFTIQLITLLFRLVHLLKRKQYIPKYLCNFENERLLCLYYKKISSANELNKLFNEIKDLSLNNNYDYCIYCECTTCDHQIEPFDNEITELGLELCNELNMNNNTNRFHFVYRKRNKDFNYNIWRGFDQFNGSIKDIYDLITNNLNQNEKDNLFSCYTSNFNQYDYLMYFNNINEFNALIDNFGILLHPYNQEYKAITYGFNYYNESFMYDSFIMKLEDIEYAKGTNGLIVKKSFSIGTKNYSIENLYKNNLRILFNKKNTTKIQYLSVLNNVISIIFDISLYTSLLLLLLNNVKTIYFILFLILFIKDIVMLPVNLYYKLKVIICYLLSKKYRYDKLPLYLNNKCLFIYIINIIILMILCYLNSFNILNISILIIIYIIYIIKALISNRRHKND